MTSSFRALWLLLWPTPQPRLPKNSWWSERQGVRNFLALLIMFSLSSAYILSGLGNAHKVATTPGHPQVQELNSWGVAHQQIYEFNLHRVYNRIRESPSPEKLPPVALVGPPKETDMMRGFMSSQGVSLINNDCTGCIVLEWYPKRGWHAQYIPDENQRDFSTSGEAIITVSEALRTAVSEQQQSHPSITVAPNQANLAILGLIASSLVGISHFILLALAWVLIISMGLRGYRWDIHRSTGKLEPLVSTQHQAWVLYVSQLSRQVAGCFIIFGTFLLVSWICNVPLIWPLALSAWISLPFFCFAVGLWGMLATVLFHHPKGRMFSRFLLSPITVGVMWTIRVYFLFMAMRWKSPVLAWKSLDRLESDWPYVLWTIPPLVILSAALLWAIQYRIGARREGLRKAI